MPIINSVINWIMKKRIHQIELFMKYPGEVQAEWLKKLLSTAKHTEFGKQYSFEDINSYETFKERTCQMVCQVVGYYGCQEQIYTCEQTVLGRVPF